MGADPPDGLLAEAERTKHVVAVFARHGLDIFGERAVHHVPASQARAEHLREALEELGTVYIKLGQFISSQSTVLPPPYQRELDKLDDAVPPVPGGQIEQIIKRSLGLDVDKAFSAFDSTALGSASIGQVHAATLSNGRDVVVKVKKPNVDALVELDLKLIGKWLGDATPHLSFLRDMHADELMPEFDRTMREELDYAAEAEHTRRFARHLAARPGLVVPDVIDDRTAGDVICEARLSGAALLDASVVPQDSQTRRTLIDDILWLVLEPGLREGVFHADPHGGNLLWTTDSKLGVLDFGKVGRLSRPDRRHIVLAFAAMSSGNPERLTSALLALAQQTHDVDRVSLQAGVATLLHRYGDAAVGDINVTDGVEELIALCRSNGLWFPGNLVLFFKALAITESLVSELDPTVSFARLVGPQLKKIVREWLESGEAVDEVAEWAFRAGVHLAELPGRVTDLASTIAAGRLEVQASLTGLPSTTARLDSMVDRLIAAVLVAAGVIGTAVVVAAYRPEVVTGVAALPWVLAGVVLTFVVRASGRLLRRMCRRGRG